MAKVYDGNLTLANSRPGILVRCVRLPSTYFLELWKKHLHVSKWDFEPELGKPYMVRGNVSGPDVFEERYQRGVLLTSADGKNKDKYINTHANYMKGVTQVMEPYFEFLCFSIIPARPSIPPRMIVRGRR
jgi:hypothetical protein